MTKGHHENLIKRVLKIAVGFLPAYLPGRIYQIASTVPLLKSLVNVTIKSIIPASIKITEGEILLNKSDVAVSGALALGMFEKRELAMLRSSIKNGMNVIDIGANIGLYTVISSRRVGPSGKVFAYEPEEENFSLLSKNIEFNKLKNVTPIKMALANVAGNRTLYMAKDNKGHHSFSDDSSSDKKILVPTDTLDQSLIKYGSPKIDLIKMDIEGAEPLALEGMSGTISKNPNIIIFTEFYPKAIRRLGYDPINFLKSLSNFGFSIWVIDENKAELEHLEVGQFGEFIQNFPRGEAFKNLYASKTPYKY